MRKDMAMPYGQFGMIGENALRATRARLQPGTGQYDPYTQQPVQQNPNQSFFNYDVQKTMAGFNQQAAIAAQQAQLQRDLAKQQQDFVSGQSREQREYTSGEAEKQRRLAQDEATRQAYLKYTTDAGVAPDPKQYEQFRQTFGGQQAQPQQPVAGPTADTGPVKIVGLTRPSYNQASAATNADILRRTAESANAPRDMSAGPRRLGATLADGTQIDLRGQDAFLDNEAQQVAMSPDAIRQNVAMRMSGQAMDNSVRAQAQDQTRQIDARAAQAHALLQNPGATVDDFPPEIFMPAQGQQAPQGVTPQQAQVQLGEVARRYAPTRGEQATEPQLDAAFGGGMSRRLGVVDTAIHDANTAQNRDIMNMPVGVQPTSPANIRAAVLRSMSIDPTGQEAADMADARRYAAGEQGMIATAGEQGVVMPRATPEMLNARQSAGRVGASGGTLSQITFPPQPLTSTPTSEAQSVQSPSSAPQSAATPLPPPKTPIERQAEGAINVQKATVNAQRSAQDARVAGYSGQQIINGIVKGIVDDKTGWSWPSTYRGEVSNSNDADRWVQGSIVDMKKAGLSDAEIIRTVADQAWQAAHDAGRLDETAGQIKTMVARMAQAHLNKQYATADAALALPQQAPAQ